ncbi:hypothetical protein NP493_415g03001 [Ridgeia piscesae]|uniref:Uncharacterized protein n=1 Tax=Ridgeia piscesae TaxID=27915 RepID=A0AAD9L1U6_RIDPI|nr:hypothetical protein NP493_415g03001 [Ridgeia piscesae]
MLTVKPVYKHLHSLLRHN